MKDSSPAEPRYVGGTTPEHVLFVVALSGVLRSASGTSYGAALDPAGTYAFISRANGQQILAFAIDQQTFAMTAGPTTTVAFYPAGVIVNPKAPFLYAAGPRPWCNARRLRDCRRRRSFSDRDRWGRAGRPRLSDDLRSFRRAPLRRRHRASLQ